MFVLGHLGIGSKLVSRLQRKPPAWPLYFGCLLPDLIDKPLFYGLHLLHGSWPLIAGTRTFGHTGLFLLALLAGAALLRRPWATAIAAGVVTHFALDIAGELVTGADPDSSIWLAVFFPAYGPHFPVAHFTSLLEHLRISAQSGFVLAGEIAGGILLVRAFRQRSS